MYKTMENEYTCLSYLYFFGCCYLHFDDALDQHWDPIDIEIIYILDCLKNNYWSICVWAGGGVGTPLGQFLPSDGMFLLTILVPCFFCGLFGLFLSCFVMLTCVSVY